MSVADYDAVVIGAGQAGPGVAVRWAGQGTVALVEQDQVGGTCLNSGCRPSKTLRASAHVAHLARNAASFGVSAGPVGVDLSAVVARKDQLVDMWRSGLRTYLEQTDGLKLLTGRARFTGTDPDGRHRLTVRTPSGEDLELRAPRVALDLGARSVPPDLPGLEGSGWLDHHGILDLTELPEHLVVLGGSYIGLEFAQIFARFGCKVTVLERSAQLLPREDTDVAAALGEVLAAEGIEIRTGVGAQSVARTAAGVEVRLADGGVVTGSHLLVAAGRVPNSDEMGLETVGVELDERGYIRTDDVYETSTRGIWALGDVNGRGAFTHTAYQDYEILVDHLAGGPRSVSGRVTTYALFTDPPLGRVGMTERQAARYGRPVLRATYPMYRVARAVIEGEPHGFIKVLVDADTDRFLGAAVLGTSGDEVVQVISALMQADVPAAALRTMLGIHPTVTELLPTALAGLAPLDAGSKTASYGIAP